MEPTVLRPMTLGEIIRQTFSLYGNTLATVVTLALIAQIPLLILSGVVSQGSPPDPATGVVLLILLLVVTGVIVNAIYLALLSSFLDKPISLTLTLRASFQRAVGAVLIGYVLTTFLSNLGLVLLVIPGLLMGGLLAVSVPAIIVERKGAFAGMGRSFTLLRPQWMKGIGVFAFGTFFSELLPLQLILGLQLWVGPGPFTPLLAALLSAIAMPISLAANLLLYVSLRAAEQSPNTVNTVRLDLQRILPSED